MSIELVDITLIMLSIRAKRLMLWLNQDPASRDRRLPTTGAFQTDGELDDFVHSELITVIGDQPHYMEQLYTFNDLSRLVQCATGGGCGLHSDDQRQRLTIAYLVALSADCPDQIINRRWPGGWSPLWSNDQLDGGEQRILKTARERFVAKTSYSNIALMLMPARFTLTELQDVYEKIMNNSLDKRNFRKRILSLGWVRETGEWDRGGNHRPARYYESVSPSQLAFFR